jgi:hypothetical protein
MGGPACERRRSIRLAIRKDVWPCCMLATHRQPISFSLHPYGKLIQGSCEKEEKFEAKPSQEVGMAQAWRFKCWDGEMHTFPPEETPHLTGENHSMILKISLLPRILVYSLPASSPGKLRFSLQGCTSQLELSIRIQVCSHQPHAKLLNM